MYQSVIGEEEINVHMTDVHAEVKSLRFHVAAKDSTKEIKDQYGEKKFPRAPQIKCKNCGGWKTRDEECSHLLAIQNGWKEIKCDVSDFIL